MLSNRQPSEVNYGGLLVGWLLTEVLPQLREETKSDECETYSFLDPTIYDLVRLRGQVPIDELVDFPDASWPELLATYAVGRLGQAHIAFQQKRDRFENAEVGPDEDDREFARTMDRKFLGDLLEAIDAAHHAERLLSIQDDAAMEAELLFTHQQRDKALKRHQPTNEAKEEFFEFWLLGGHKNRSEAARSFLRKLDKEDRNPFIGERDNTVRTLRRALRLFLQEEPDSENEDSV